MPSGMSEVKMTPFGTPRGVLLAGMLALVPLGLAVARAQPASSPDSIRWSIDRDGTLPANKVQLGL